MTNILNLTLTVQHVLPHSNIYPYKDLLLISQLPLVPPVGQTEGCWEAFCRGPAFKQKRILMCTASGEEAAGRRTGPTLSSLAQTVMLPEARATP